MFLNFRSSTLLTIVLSISSLLFGQEWTGAADANWNNPANWSQVPSNGDDVVIDPANYTGGMFDPVVSVNSNFVPGEMLVQGAAHLTISANLSASDRVEILGDNTILEINGGTFSVDGGGNNARLIIADDAGLQMSGGSLVAGQRLLFELGGHGLVTGGTINVGETLALVDGSVLQSSFLELSGGTINATGEFAYENEAGQYFPRFTQTGGTLNVNGDLIWLGASPGSGAGYFQIQGGDTKVTGNVLNDPTSTMNAHIRISDDGEFRMLGAQVSLLANDSIVLVEQGRWTESNGVVWQNNGVILGEASTIFTSGNTTLLGNGEYHFGTLLIPAGKQFTHVQPAAISVSGDFLATGLFNHAGNRLILDGTDVQEIQSNSALHLSNLTINNSLPGSYGLLMLTNISVQNSFDLLSGLVSIPTPYILQLQSDAVLSGGSDTAFISGYVGKTGNAGTVFPLGAAPDHYRPLTISGLSNPSTSIRTAYFRESYNPVVPVESPLLSVSTIEYWDLQRTGSSDLPVISAGWNDASQSGLVACDDISLSSWNGAEWTFIPSTVTGLCSGQESGSIISSVPVQEVGPVTFGFTENIYQQSVELCPGDSLIMGDTSYAQSGVYTDIFETTSGEDSIVVTVLNVLQPLDFTFVNDISSITATVPNAVSFQWIDCATNLPVSGATSNILNVPANGSYALVAYQDGCPVPDTSACVTVTQLNLVEATTPSIILYPNPVQQGYHISLKMEGNATSPKQIISIDGKVQQVEFAFSDGVFNFSTTSLSPGVYILELNEASRSGRIRFVVQ